MSLPAQHSTKDENRSQDSTIDWNLCILCQDATCEKLNDPTNSTNKHIDGASGYLTVSRNLIKLKELGSLSPAIQLENLDDGYGIEETLITQQAKWHKTCFRKIDNQKISRIEMKRKKDGSQQTESSTKKTRQNCDSSSSLPGSVTVRCFFLR